MTTLIKAKHKKESIKNVKVNFLKIGLRKIAN